MNDLPPAIRSRIDAWLTGPYDDKTKSEIQKLLKENPQALSDAFFKDLSFGTGGMRGIMGVGTNRMNIYTVRKASQGLANYLKNMGSVFIGYDVRNHSKEFAITTARVLAANGIKVFLTKDICPTPMVSFGCRHFKCKSAVMITASHNPPEYNGYKVYWEDGAQITPPHDQGIIDEVHRVDKVPALAPKDSPLIQLVGDEFDAIYLEEIKKLQLLPELKKIKIIYSPLHGTGIRILPEALKSWGYKDIHIVEEQRSLDGNFSSAPSPNPEEKAALELGTKQLISEEGDLLIATDPDADRIGVVSKGPHQLSGNQVACLLLDHICISSKLPPKATFVKTIVTSELFCKIAKNYGGMCVDVLTGFKYIGAKMAEWEKDKTHTYVFGAEESCGYLFGDFVRDKDAISSACLITEAAAKAKAHGKTLHDLLYDLYRKYGVHREHLISLKFSDSEKSMRQMQEKMQNLRRNPPQEINGKKVSKVEDFLPGSAEFPPSNVVRLWLEDETKIVVRPSGTEPKIKIYIEVVEALSPDIEGKLKACNERIQSIGNFLKKEFE